MKTSSQTLNQVSSKLKVAVIGSGISGLAAAWLLGQEHEVVLYEKNAKLGGHTNTIQLTLPEGNTPVDTGFIVFNRPNYPHLSAMFAHFGVQTQPTKMSFGVSVDAGRLEYAGSNLNSLFAQRRNLFSWSHWQMLREIARFNRQAKADLIANESHPEFEVGKYIGDLALPLGDYLHKHGFDGAMQNAYLLPMAAAIWSCPVEAMMAFPAGSFLRFFENHGLLNIKDRPQWETVVGGSQRYIDKILRQQNFAVRLQSAVEKVEEIAGGKLRVICQQDAQEFDQVVFASHGDQTYRMLSHELQQDFDFLNQFRYQQNIAYLHSDASLMPRRKLAWSSWNYLRDSTQPEEGVAVTYWMNLLQNLNTQTQVFVTLNPIVPPAKEKTWQRIVYEHPVFDLQAMDAQHLVRAFQGHKNLWFCGAYNGYGFHEDGLRSAVEIARAWQLPIPWEKSASAAGVLNLHTELAQQRIATLSQGAA